MKLTYQEVKELQNVSKWLGVDPEHLLHKIIQHQLTYCSEVRLECSQDNCTAKKYQLAQSLRLLD